MSTTSPSFDSGPDSPSFPDELAIVARLRAAGCVFAEDEARLLISAARTPGELATMVDRRADGLPVEHVLGWAEFYGLRISVDPGVFVPRRRTEFLTHQAAALAHQATTQQPPHPTHNPDHPDHPDHVVTDHTATRAVDHAAARAVDRTATRAVDHTATRATDRAVTRVADRPADRVAEPQEDHGAISAVGRTAKPIATLAAAEPAGSARGRRVVVVDLCCGSGAVGAALAATVDGIDVYAADLDPAAVRCARRNLAAAARRRADVGATQSGGGDAAQPGGGDGDGGRSGRRGDGRGGGRGGGGRSRGGRGGNGGEREGAGGDGGDGAGGTDAGEWVFEGDLFAALPDVLRGRIDVLVANAPYVPTGEIALLPAEAREHEPYTALDGGEDGLDVVRRVIAEAPSWLAPGGHLLIETSRRQADETLVAAARAGLRPRVAWSEEFAATVVIAVNAVSGNESP